MSTLEEDFKKYETSYRKYYGSDYDKALNNLKTTKKCLKDEFKKKYPNAHLDSVRKFTIYVNARSGFPSNFETLETSWKCTTNDITKMAVDKEDPYFASLLAAYIISNVGGISRKHLTGDRDNKVIRILHDITFTTI